MHFDFGDEIFQEGQYVQANCLASEGDLPITIKWKLNGKPIEKFHEISAANIGRRTSILTIESVSYGNVGNYTCVASNSAGKSEYTTMLLVNG